MAKSEGAQESKPESFLGNSAAIFGHEAANSLALISSSLQYVDAAVENQEVDAHTLKTTLGRAIREIDDLALSLREFCLSVVQSQRLRFEIGDLCLSGLGARLETATAMKGTILKQIPSSQFLARLSRDSLLEGFVRYLALRIAAQQQVIANMVTVDSEQRLGKTLLQLARTLGQKNPHGLRIDTKISHEELSEMVGTTRPRVSMFMERFRKHGLLETGSEHCLVVNEKKLTDYLIRIAIEGGHRRNASNHFFPAVSVTSQ